jgi:hypothetical protein
MGLVDEYFPFDLGHGYPANTARWRKMAQLWQSDGVLQGYLNQLNATLAGTTVTVQTGGLFLHGYYGEVQTAQSITGVGTNGTVVAGVDLVNQTVSIYYRDGVVDYGSGGYEQDTSKWETPLWLVQGTSLVDFRTMINPGAGCGWWHGLSGSWSVPTSTTNQIQFLGLRVPYAGSAVMRGELLVTYSDASAAQSVICQLTYQYGNTDQQTTLTSTPSIPGGGPAGVSVTSTVSLSGLLSVTQGKKNVGWRVTAGTGPGISVSALGASVQMLNVPTIN